jgi:hypothetical protein
MRRLIGAAKRALQGNLPGRLGSAVARYKTRDPRTFPDYIRYKLARDRRLLLVMYADKFACRRFVAERIGKEVLTELFAVGSSASAIDWAKLPREYVVKVNHGSGGVVVVSEIADPLTRLPIAGSGLGWTRHVVHPESVDLGDLSALVDYWLSIRYQQGPFMVFEWAYGEIEPLVFVESCVADRGALPTQLRFYCFEGAVREVLVDHLDINAFVSDEMTRHFVPHFEFARESAGVDEATWRLLLRNSAALSREADMVRVDWLLGRGAAWFSELTSYPAAGAVSLAINPHVSAQQVDVRLRSFWRLPDDYRLLDEGSRPLALRHLARGEGFTAVENCTV